MRTDEVRVALRLRSGLEAIDLGFAMTRRWLRPLAASWCGFVLPIAAAAIAALHEHPWWTLLLLWWLRPLFGRVPLLVLSRALFGRSVGFLETAAAMPELLRSGLAHSLFAQRLSPARTFLLPVLQLEGLRGRARRERCALLARRDLGVAIGLCAAVAHFHAAILLGLLAGIALLVPAEADWNLPDLFFASSGDDGSALPLLLPVLYLAGLSVVEPLLVASGFGLYLNRRVYLEGWDIDLRFRQLARRASARGARALPILCGACLFAGADAQASPATRCVPDAVSSAVACIQEVIASEDFGRREQVSSWKLRDDLFDPDSDREPLDLGWLSALAEALATAGEVVLWAALAAGVLAIGVTLARAPPRRAPAPGPDSRAAPALQGLDLDPRSLPGDLVGAARDAWRRGAHSDALSLLYRGALVQLSGSGALAIPDSATELECLRLVEQSGAAPAFPAFAQLTDAWLHARYAAAAPRDEVFESLCAGYAAAFGAAS